MVVVVYFLSKDNNLEYIILDLVKVEGSHEGVNLAPYILRILEE